MLLTRFHLMLRFSSAAFTRSFRWIASGSSTVVLAIYTPCFRKSVITHFNDSATPECSAGTVPEDPYFRSDCTTLQYPKPSSKVYAGTVTTPRKDAPDD